MKFSTACLASVLVCAVTAGKANLLLASHEIEVKEAWDELPTRVSSLAEHKKKHTDVRIDETKRPVFGVLSEPIRGSLHTKKAHHHLDDPEVEGDQLSYIPKAHV